MGGLRKEWNNGDARVATNDGDSFVSGVGGFDLGEETRGADDVEGCYAEEAFRIVDAFGFEDFRADGDGGVDLILFSEVGD